MKSDSEHDAAANGKYSTLRLPLTAALVRAGLAGLSMSTPGHRMGRLFGAWTGEVLSDPQAE
jgi:hypothetical protein